MKHLCLGAAFAVAAAAAHCEFADALGHSQKLLNLRNDDNTTPTEVEELGSDQNNCLSVVNQWRKQIDSTLPDYKVDSTNVEDFKTFVKSQTCKQLREGNFEHIQSSKIVVITASTKTSDETRSAEEATCEEALAIWKKGYDVIHKANAEIPPKYTDNQNTYKDPNATALVTLLSDEEKNILCKHATGCDKDLIVCSVSWPDIATPESPVKPNIWHSVQVNFKTKPLIKQHDHGDQCLAAVNGVRQKEPLKLPAFTSTLSRGRSRRSPRDSSAKKYQELLYQLTCEDVTKERIHPAGAENYTVIYHIKDGDTAPTPEEAVAYWESGFEKLNNRMPPKFNSDSIFVDEEEEQEEELAAKDVSAEAVDESKIYEDSSVSGYASIMTDKTRKMECFDATGCGKSGIICVIENATLVDDESPISEETWKKIEEMHGIVRPELTPLDGDASCLAEMNAERTQEGIALKEFTAAADKKTSQDNSALLQGVTCGGLKDSSVKVVDSNSSLMYYFGSEATCANAVSEWKKGLAKLSDKTSLPTYSSNEGTYKDAAVTNFVSLMSDGENTKVKCYSATCSEEETEGLVCELTPAALKDGEAPISNDNWKKITENMSANGLTTSFSMTTMLISAVLALVGLVVQL